MKCANNLFYLTVFIEKQATILCEFLSDMPAGEDKNAYEKRRNAAYVWSCVDKKDIEKKIENADSNFDRVQKFIDELKPSKKVE